MLSEVQNIKVINKLRGCHGEFDETTLNTCCHVYFMKLHYIHAGCVCL